AALLRVSCVRSFSDRHDDQIVGRDTAWHFNGTLLRDGKLADDGEREGTWTWWFPDGRVAAKGEFEHGRPSGTWGHWYPNGQKLRDSSYGREGHEILLKSLTEHWPSGTERVRWADGGRAMWTDASGHVVDIDKPLPKPALVHHRY